MGIRITLPHLIERLEQLAAHRTPGYVPEFPVPIGEHHFLRAAAQCLREMHADLEGLRHTHHAPADHRMWAIVDDRTNGVVHFEPDTTKESMQQFIVNTHTPAARNWVVRPMYIGQDL